MLINARNVNEAFTQVFWLLKSYNFQPEQTRNGPVIAFPEPAITTYERPTERVLFCAERDANPIFHLMESIWMLAGRRDLGFLHRFNSNMGKYSDDGEVFNAAYGYRWRTQFGLDQLTEIVDMLRTEPATRQAVLQMWSPSDLSRKTKDKACNLSAVFDLRGGVLNMSVFNRSNDIWYGAYGANAVHFSFLQEFIASSLGVSVGKYHQISSNFHLYTELYPSAALIHSPPVENDPYALGIVMPRPIFDHGSSSIAFLADCQEFCTAPESTTIRYNNLFFHEVAQPMASAAADRRERRNDGLYWARRIAADDWRKATMEWIARREAKR